jgi:uncharacterized protein with PQ loop repeat
MDEVKGLGRSVFAATFLLIGCVLNVIYGISAISNSHFFTHNAHYVFGDLKTWGWVTLIIGVLEGFAGVSLFQGGTFGRWFAILAASLAAITALLDISASPFWSLAVFALSLWIIHGLVLYGQTAPTDDYPAALDMGRDPVGRR